MSISESGEIINRLRDAGLNMESIGQAIGRDRSLVRQVGIGAKPGNNLRDSLAALEARVARLGVSDRAAANAAARAASVPRPRARLTTAGTVARTRKPTTIEGRAFTTSNVKRQAARHGARSMARPLGAAAEAGRQVAATVTFNKSVQVQAYSKGKRGRAGAGGSLDFKIGDAAEVRAEADERFGGNLAALVCAQAIERGLITGVADERDAVQGIVSIEMRTF